MKNILLSLFLAIIFVLPVARPAQALGPLIDSSVLSDTDCVGPACQYSLNTFMKLGINVANIILGIVGAVALVVFVYGGIRMMASGGNAEAVSTGKKSIVGAVIGLLLVFGSYSLISFTVNTVLKADGNYQFNGNINAEVPAVVSPNPTCAKAGGVCKDKCGAGDIGYGSQDCGSQFCCSAKPNANECARNSVEGCLGFCPTACQIPSKTCSGDLGGMCCQLNQACWGNQTPPRN